MTPKLKVILILITRHSTSIFSDTLTFFSNFILFPFCCSISLHFWVLRTRKLLDLSVWVPCFCSLWRVPFSIFGLYRRPGLQLKKLWIAILTCLLSCRGFFANTARVIYSWSRLLYYFLPSFHTFGAGKHYSFFRKMSVSMSVQNNVECFRGFHSFQRPFSSCSLLKVLLRRNFDVMFFTKTHLYQLSKEDYNLTFHRNEDFHPANWKKLALKSCLFASAIVNLHFSDPAAWRCGYALFRSIVFLSWRHFLNSRWRLLMLSW